MPTTSFTQLDVWKKAYALTLELYRITVALPREERYRLADQLIRASMSVPTNLAEGYGRRMPRDKAHFYTIASGSAEELKCWLMLACDLGLIQDLRAFLPRVEDVTRMLHRLIDATLASSAP
jgi:four helix bundle protein